MIGLAACGGTTGLEHVDRGPGLDARSPDVADAGLDATLPPNDGDGADPGRPPPRESGVTFAIVDASATADAQSADAARTSTLGILAAQGAACVSLESDGGPAADACAVTSGCLDPAQLGGTCEEPPDGSVPPAAGNLGYTAMCLKTLGDILATGCATGPLLLTPCVCGAADPGQCLAGSVPPSGGVTWQDYVADFGTTDPRPIEAQIVLQTYGSGQADALVQCLAIAGCSACLGNAPDAGN